MTYTKKDFPIGQHCHYGDESGRQNYHLIVTAHRPVGGMIILKSPDGKIEFGLYPTSVNLHPIKG